MRATPLRIWEKLTTRVRSSEAKGIRIIFVVPPDGVGRPGYVCRSLDLPR